MQVYLVFDETRKDWHDHDSMQFSFFFFHALPKSISFWYLGIYKGLAFDFGNG